MKGSGTMKFKAIEDISVGDTEKWTRTITETDVVVYAGLIGDRGPLHLDEEFAKTTRFGKRVSYGMLSAGYIGATLAQLLGVRSAYVSQNLRFTAPVLLGDTITVTTAVTSTDKERSRIWVDTVVTRNDGVVALEGEAELFIFRIESPAEERSSIEN
jgi:3-hydroxybutyryl-CoA dehydratase